jgi:hypothetical protein
MSLKNGDLSGTILPYVSIDEFEPKAGKERDVIVVAFYLNDQGPAEDLNTFIQRGFVDTLDVEASPNTDEEGRYLVFVEMLRDKDFPDNLRMLLKDVKNLCENIKWIISTYYSMGKSYSIDDPELFNYVILDPAKYVSKEKFKMPELNEDIKQFFKDSLITNLTINEKIVKLSYNRQQIITEIVDVGDYDTVIGRNFLSESAFGVGQNSYEAKVLQSILGNCQILPLGKYLCVSRDDKIMLLKNTQLNYGN